MVSRLRAAGAAVVPPIIVSRVMWLAVVLGVALISFHTTPLMDAIRGSLLHWDAISYIDIVEHGYPAHLDYHDAFLPGYPMTVRVVQLVARDPIVAAWIASLLAEAVALWYGMRLVSAERDRSGGTFAVWLLALAPTALFLVAPFTESAFIAAAAAALYHARQGRPLAAAVAAAAATAVRLTGLALIPALALETLARNRWRPGRDLLRIAIVPIPLLAYCAYMQAHTGDALALLHAEQLPSFGQRPVPPWEGFATTWNTMATALDGEIRSIFAREIAFGLLGLVACIGMWASSRIPRSFAMYCSVAWLLTASLSFWRSEPRYLLALFPAVLLLIDLTRRARAARPAIVVGSAILMCIGTWVFAEGHWLG